MVETGLVRRMDDLGRIVVPRKVRELLYGKPNLDGVPFEIFVDGDAIIFKPHNDRSKWEPIVNAYGELIEFMCPCGCSTQGASNFCPDCGAKKDNSTIEEDILAAKKKVLGE